MKRLNSLRFFVAVLISQTLLGGCVHESESDSQSSSYRGDDGIEFESKFVGATDVEGIRLEYVQVDCDTGGETDPGDSGAAGPIQLAGDGTFKIPGGIESFEGTLDKDSEHVFADLLFVPSPVGEGDEFCYDLVTYPVKADGTDSEDCEPTVKRGVRYRRGELTEGEVIINQCLGVDPGGIDAVDALNHEPEIVDFYFEESKFVCEGETQRVCATVVDPDKDPVSFEWVVAPAGQNVLGPNEITQTVDEASGAITECATFVSDDAGRYTVELTVYDMMIDSDGSPIKVETWLNREQDKLTPEGEEDPEPFESRAEFNFFFYVSDCPEEPTTIPAADRMGTGFSHSCVIDDEAQLWCWGDNYRGQLGTGGPETQLVPGLVSGGHQWKSVFTGGNHTCAVEKTEERLYCWGAGYGGPLGNGSTDDQPTPVPISMGPSGDYRWSKLTGGIGHTCGIEAETGRLFCWGVGSYGRLGVGDTSNRLVPTEVSGGRAWLDVQAGQYTVCGIELNSHSLFCWGRGNYGQLGNGSGSNQSTPRAVVGDHSWGAVSSGNSHTCAIRASDKSVWCFGRGEDGRLGDGDASEHNELAPVEVQGGRSWSSIAAGGHHTCAIEEGSGALFCWGQGVLGTLANGNTQNSSEPVAASLNGEWAATEGGAYHSCGIRLTDGKFYCWGYGRNGRLGTGDIENRLNPTEVSVLLGL